MSHEPVNVLGRPDVAEAIRHLRRGGVVAIPTDTVYGLAAALEHPGAVERIFAIKGRALDKAIPVLMSDPALLDRLGRDVTDEARCLASTFWPGPLTIVVEASERVPPVVLRGGRTVGLRMPANDLTLAIIDAVGGALAVTSANQSGSAEARSASEVCERLGMLVDAIVDGGPSPSDRPSTVIDATLAPVGILRAGSLDPAAILACLEGSSRER